MATTTSAKRQAAASVKRAKDDVVADADDVAEATAAVGRKARGQAGEFEASMTRSAEELTAAVTDTLRSVGVDTDRMVDVAKEQATELQRLIAQEIQERPLRALGLAAAVGLFVGFIAAR